MRANTRILSGRDMKRIFVTRTVALLFAGVPLTIHAASSDQDHLVPVKEASGLSAVYRKVWERQLLVTPGEIARFVSLPGTSDVETAVSVYRKPGKNKSLPGDYWVTATQASKSLWRAVESKSDPRKTPIQRCDAPIPESTALAVHKAWMAMLVQTKPRQASGISVDSSQELFSAAKSDGAILEGESSSNPKQNIKALIDIALSFMGYCDAPVGKRPKIANKIEKTASNLLTRMASDKDAKATTRGP
jgi:hypothetical protein